MDCAQASIPCVSVVVAKEQVDALGEVHPVGAGSPGVSGGGHSTRRHVACGIRVCARARAPHLSRGKSESRGARVITNFIVRKLASM